MHLIVPQTRAEENLWKLFKYNSVSGFWRDETFEMKHPARRIIFSTQSHPPTNGCDKTTAIGMNGSVAAFITPITGNGLKWVNIGIRSRAALNFLSKQVMRDWQLQIPGEDKFSSFSCGNERNGENLFRSVLLIRIYEYFGIRCPGLGFLDLNLKYHKRLLAKSNWADLYLSL